MTKISNHTGLFYWNIAALCWCKIILCSRVSFAFLIFSSKRSVLFNASTSSSTGNISRGRQIFIGTRKDANRFGVSSFRHRRRPLFVPLIQASSSSANDDDIDHSNDEEETEETDATWLNLELIGVSVSPLGFLLLYQTSWLQMNNTTQTITLPIRISTEDTKEAKSIEALTILQLINGIDMAGTTFPPNVLTSLAALKVILLKETDQHIFVDEAVQLIHQAMRNALDGISYEEATPWQRNKIQYPKISLPRVRISVPETSLCNTTTTTSTTNIPLPIQFHLECTIQSMKPLSIPLFSEHNFLPQDNTVESVPLEDLDIYGIINPLTSAAFLSLALSLRYKASVGMYSTDLQRLIVWSETSNITTIIGSGIFTTISNTEKQEHPTNSRIAHYLPNWKSIQSIRNVNERVTESFGQNFEVGRLEAALQIAIDRGDEQAADKIRKSILFKQQQQQQQSNIGLFESDTNNISRELSLSTSIEGEENQKTESYLYNITTADKDEDSFQ